MLYCPRESQVKKLSGVAARQAAPISNVQREPGWIEPDSIDGRCDAVLLRPPAWRT